MGHVLRHNEGSHLIEVRLKDELHQEDQEICTYLNCKKKKKPRDPYAGLKRLAQTKYPIQCVFFIRVIDYVFFIVFVCLQVLTCCTFSFGTWMVICSLGGSVKLYHFQEYILSLVIVYTRGRARKKVCVVCIFLSSSIFYSFIYFYCTINVDKLIFCDVYLDYFIFKFG